MSALTTYAVTHKLGRANSMTADADAICNQINAVVMSNGDSIDRDRVQAELDSIADQEIQRLLKISIESATADFPQDE